MLSMFRPGHIPWSVMRWALQEQKVFKHSNVASALRSKKSKSTKNRPQHFVDSRIVRVLGGKGGDGCISFLHLWSNENAGPDGGDGGNGGHVVFHANTNVKDLKHLTTVIRGESGEKGFGDDCQGKSADHTIVEVPVGTVIKSLSGKIVGDLEVENSMFVAARGGAGGHGNHFFVSPTMQAPKISEYGADGEELQYLLEVRSMAHIGLIGYPNAGKSTLLQAISRARPKIASYPFTTLKPHLGIIQYDDFDQVAVADLPGLIPDSHKNRGLGITFLKHIERCAALLYILDLSFPQCWKHLETLQYELSQFNSELLKRPQLVIANKLDLPESEGNLLHLKKNVDLPIIAISAKMGTNIEELLKIIKKLYDESVKEAEIEESDNQKLDSIS